MRKTFLIIAACSLMCTISFTGCKKASDFVDHFKKNDPKENGIFFYTLGESKLFKYSTSKPEQVVAATDIMGLQGGEKILGLDFRPATAELYALGSNSRLYTINLTNGMATFIAALSNVPAGSTTPVPLVLSGSSFGFDFNPTVDRIRIISNTGQNLRAHPVTGVTIIDGSINPAPLSVNAVAYSNNDTLTSTATKLFALDGGNDKLYEVNPPNNGTLSDPLTLKFNLSDHGAFDIAPRNNKVTTDIGLGLFRIDGKSTLFSIEIETGEMKILARYDRNEFTALAISPE